MADTNYLYYGDQQVDQQALMNKMANGVVQYVQSQPWTRKRKDMFMSAYSDIMNKGLKGMSNSTGQWMVDFGGPAIDWDSKSRKEKEMYEEAGYFIQQQMNGLAADAKKQNEEKDEIELTPYGSKFKDVFGDYIGRTYFGNRDFNIGGEKDDWNYLDERNEQGIRGRSERAKKLASYLQSYRDSLKDSNFDFKDSPFSSKEDLITRLDSAIAALKTTDNTQDDTDALNALGLDARDWFNNGSGDIYVDENGNTAVGSDGKPLSYAQYYNNLALQEKTKQETEQKAAEEKQKALDALQIYTSRPVQKAFTLRDLSNKYSGDLNAAISNFSNVNLSQLTQEQNDELVSLFQGGYNSNALDNINDDEWEQIKSKIAVNGEDKSQYRKINGINGIYYDVAKKNLFQLSNSQQSGSKNFLAGLSDKEKKDAEQQRLIFEGSGLSGADIADIAATFTDLAGIGASFIPVVGNVAGAATGAAGSLTHFGADWSRDGLDLGDVGRLGINLAFDAATLIPGFGTAAKAGKIAKFLAPKVPYIIAGIGAVQGLSNGTEIINSFKKLSNPSTVTVEDLQNMAQGIALLAGGVNVSRGIYQSRQAKKNLKPATSSEPATIRTRNERTLELNESEYNTLSSKTATREAKQAAIESAATRSGTPLDATDGISYKGWSIKNPTRTKNTSTEVEGLTAPKTAVQGVNIGEIRERNRKWIEEHPTLSRILPGRTTDSKVNWTNEGMYIKGVKENNTAQQSTQIETPVRTPKPSTNTSNLEYFPKDANIKDVKEVQNALNAPDYKLKRETKIPQQNQNITGKLADGTSYEISFDGTNITVKGPKDLPELKGKSLHEQKQELGKWINKLNLERKPQLKKDSKEWKEFVNSIKELKRKGFLFKQGGKITDTQIDNFLKQYIKYENNSQRYS